MAFVVQKVEKLPGRRAVYDLSIEDVHNFYVNRINVHNSAEPKLICRLGS